MSKRYEQPLEETAKIFDEIIFKSNLNNYMNIDIIVDNSLKDIVKYIKSSPLYKFKTDIDVTILLNEEIFDRLDDTDEQKNRLILTDSIISAISYNSERDKITIEKEDCNLRTGIVSKYGLETTYNLDRLVTEVFKQVEEEKQENKD